MTEERPLHVRVAEALGWTEIVEAPFLPVTVSNWLGKPPAWDTGTHQFISAIDHEKRSITVNVGSIPRYDTDWSATGPLIERYGIYTGFGHIVGANFAWARCDGEQCDSQAGTLSAVCRLILALHAAGKLHLKKALR